MKHLPVLVAVINKNWSYISEQRSTHTHLCMIFDLPCKTFDHLYMTFGHLYTTFGHLYMTFDHFAHPYMTFGHRYKIFDLQYTIFGLKYSKIKSCDQKTTKITNPVRSPPLDTCRRERGRERDVEKRDRDREGANKKKENKERKLQKCIKKYIYILYI